MSEEACNTPRMEAERCGPAPASFFAGIVTGRYFETWQFYTELLGFTTWEESDLHVLLAHPSGARLDILRHETDPIHTELVSSTDGRGFWFMLEVDDVEAEYRRMSRAGVASARPPELSIFGRKAFSVHDPNGVLICLCERQSMDAGDEDETSFSVGSSGKTAEQLADDSADGAGDCLLS